MLYCPKCGTMYDLPMESLTHEIDPWWARNRRDCPDIQCRGYVYDIDEEMIPVIEMIKSVLEDGDCCINIAPLWSCASHWYKETKDCPNVPYLTIAILPDSISHPAMKPIDRGDLTNQVRRFVEDADNAIKWRNLMVEIDDDLDCVHPMFADLNGDLHQPDEGWVPITIRLDYNKMIEKFHLAYEPYDHEISYKKYLDYVNDPVNRLIRHCQYISLFTSELIILLNHLKQFQIEGGTNDDKC